jgi:hypothetical protein
LRQPGGDRKRGKAPCDTAERVGIPAVGRRDSSSFKEADMPNWDDPRGPRHDQDRDRWRRDQIRERGGPGGERRVFGEPRGEGSGRERYGRSEDAGSAGYAQRERRGGESSVSHGGEPYAYGGQEYGVESYGGRMHRAPNWGFERDGERRRGFDFDDPGVGQSQAGYAAGTRSHSEHDFDPDYLRWREEQLRAHDRDYEAWRRDQHRQYDEQYHQFCNERQRHFGEAFHEWRTQRSAVGGAPDTSVSPGVSGYGDKIATPGGHAYDKPTGYLDPPGHMSSDPVMSQRGGPGGHTALTPPPGSDLGPEFGKEPTQVQSTSDGDVQGHDQPHKDGRH